MDSYNYESNLDEEMGLKRMELFIQLRLVNNKLDLGLKQNVRVGWLGLGDTNSLVLLSFMKLEFSLDRGWKKVANAIKEVRISWKQEVNWWCLI